MALSNHQPSPFRCRCSGSTLLNLNDIIHRCKMKGRRLGAPEAQLDTPVVLLVQSKSASIVTLPLPVETESAEMHSWLQLITCANRS